MLKLADLPLFALLSDLSGAHRRASIGILSAVLYNHLTRQRYSSDLRDIMQKMTLEEAIATVSFLVYGLTSEVLGLWYAGYSLSQPNPVLTITYHNKRYMPRLTLNKGPAFIVSSRLGSRRIYQELVCPPQYDPRLIRRPLVLGSGSEAADPLKRVTPEILKEEFILDGIHFIGEINYYPDPLFFSLFAIRSAQTQLLGQTRGPSLEEVYELIKSLHMLNGKQVE